MNFFSHQDRARGNTRKLVFLFICAVLALIVITSFLVIVVLNVAGEQTGTVGFNPQFLTSEIFLTVSAAVIAVVVLGALYRLAQLRGGGRSVAEAMGGRLLNTSSHDANERKILNVVEEMAIASGLPVPPVYLIDDPGINAFAAGYRKEDAVIGITRGSIEQLSRDELQGVIAHEFSHVFNGDMRLNIRLMGLLYGIMVLGLIGYFLMRGGMYSSLASRSRGRRGGGILALGLGLVVIGFAGTFFGNMIKAAVSRQREFLADASAVQYTRNPAGISGALKKIGGYPAGSRITSHDASEISHMLFGEGVKVAFTGLMATHPPLPERIRKIEPGWNGDFDEPFHGAGEETDARAAGFSAGGAATSAVDSIGNPSAEHIGAAVSRLDGIPATLRDEAHDPLGAGVLMYALIAALSGPDVARRQRAILEQGIGRESYRTFEKCLDRVRQLPREDYLPLVDIALPALKQMSKLQYRTFMSFLSQLIVADEKISLFEWCIFRILRHSLDERPSKSPRTVALKGAGRDCEVLLSLLAAAGHDDDDAAKAAFELAAAELDLPGAMTYRPRHDGDIEALDTALGRLAGLKPLQKPRLLKAMTKCINADGRVSAAESELLRAVGNLLDCPIPPLLPEQRFI